MPVRIKRRCLKTSTVDEIILEFPTFSDAVEWMRIENENPEREFDIASVSLAR